MDLSASLFFLGIVDCKHISLRIPSEEDAGFFKTLSYGSDAVDFGIDMALGRIDRGDRTFLFGVQVAAGKYVGGGERAACLYSVQEEDFILWGEEKDPACVTLAAIYDVKVFEF